MHFVTFTKNNTCIRHTEIVYAIWRVSSQHNKRNKCKGGKVTVEREREREREREQKPDPEIEHGMEGK